jgi:hypothetical protein
MTCASCGRQVATGARYCIHCGAEQSVPTPIAAVAASIAGRGGREAANAAHAEPAAGVPEPAAYDESGASLGESGVAHAANSEQPARPAYADAPQRRGLAITLLACLVVVAIAVAAYAFWRVEGARSDMAVANAPAAATAPATSAPPAVPAETATPASETPATQSSAEPASSPSMSDTSQAASVAPPPATDVNPPVEIKALPPHPAAAPAPHRAQPSKAAPAEAAKASEPGTASPETAPAARTHAAAPATPRAVDRWQRLDDELSQCTREDFIKRVICGQRVRFRYCDGYWGKVPQCPGNPTTTDRGQ